MGHRALLAGMGLMLCMPAAAADMPDWPVARAQDIIQAVSECSATSGDAERLAQWGWAVGSADPITGAGMTQFRRPGLNARLGLPDLAGSRTRCWVLAQTRDHEDGLVAALSAAWGAPTHRGRRQALWRRDGQVLVLDWFAPKSVPVALRVEVVTDSGAGRTNP